MLTAQHITSLKINRDKLAAHLNMPLPAYVRNPVAKHCKAIGETALSALLGMDPDIFETQLEAARERGVSILMENGGVRMGFSAATSIIHADGNVLDKNLIIPRNDTRCADDVDRHYIVGVFVRGKVVHGNLPEISEVEIAGWADTDTIVRCGREVTPKAFKSKLPVYMLPCRRLSPVKRLVEAADMMA